MTKPVKNQEEDKNKIAAYMNLIPEPTPTRFLGKMQKVREDRKKSEDKSKSSSRRSSIFPVKETIAEQAEADNKSIDSVETEKGNFLQC